MRNLILAAAFPLLAFPALAPALADEMAVAVTPARITVSGEGHVEATPDMATITMGMTAEADTAKAAMDQVSASLTALLAVLGEAGIEARDIQTSGLSLNPLWGANSVDSARQRIKSFAASNNVTVRVRDLDKLGPVLDQALASGANTFHGLTFGLQDPGPGMDVARAEAVADAIRKARIMAEAAGVDLGRIVSISEGGGYVPPQPMFRMEAMAATAMPVAGGEVSVAAQVTIVWELSQ